MSRHPKPPSAQSGESASSARKSEPVLPAALISNNVAKDYGDGPALYPLSLRIEEHEKVELIGHNGSGKTTFLRMATGLLDQHRATSRSLVKPPVRWKHAPN